ncbi:MAG: hypothetical protein IJT91_06750, partial [Clostridia bacterium]|nr:hypothetical protein [Clostridia bacterium]
MTWLIIIGAIAIAIVTALILKNREDHIICRENDDHFILRFEDGSERNCVLIKSYSFGEKQFSVFIPCENAGKEAAAPEDVIILKLCKKRSNDAVYTFA